MTPTDKPPPIDPDVIPQVLRERAQWVCWKYVKGRDSRILKVPFNPASDKPASATDPASWGGFDQAMLKFERGKYSGIGYVFTADDPFTGIDLDDCIDEHGEMVPSAKEIVAELNSYTEISPSGRGVKIFVVGKKPANAKCKSSAIAGFKATEVYETDRYFTVTGRHYPGTPLSVESRQPELDALGSRLWPPKQPHPRTAVPVSGGFEGDDAALIDLAGRARNGSKFKKLWDGDLSGHKGNHSNADMALCGMLAFLTGKDAARMDRLFRQSGLIREKWDERRGDRTYGGITIENAISGCTRVYTPGAKRMSAALPRTAGVNCSPTPDATSVPSSECDTRPQIEVDTDEGRVADEAILALAKEPRLFERGNALVRVIECGPETSPIRRARCAAAIDRLSQPALRELLTRVAIFTVRKQNGDMEQVHPRTWLVEAIHCRGRWDGIRHLRGIVGVPVLRSDGTVWQSPGYDQQTGVLYCPGCRFPPVPETPDVEDARRALDLLLGVVSNFRFESESHRAAWLAGLLTPLARYAFAGQCPLFAIDANVRGAGKTLLAKVIGTIVQGHQMAVCGYPQDVEEMRKVITSIAMSGDPLALLDNVVGPFGDAAMDRALTSEIWKDRLLGTNQVVELELPAIWYATGNNLQFRSDTLRRVVHIRLDVALEHPEQRSGFEHPNLLEWVAGERPALVVAAITLLKAFILHKPPEISLPPLGGFESWSDMIRGAIVWMGMPDPCQTKLLLDTVVDADIEALGHFMNAWSDLFPGGSGTVAELLERAYAPPERQGVAEQMQSAMQTAIAEFTDREWGVPPDARKLGTKLRTVKGRVVNGRRFIQSPHRHARTGAVWMLTSN